MISQPDAELIMRVNELRSLGEHVCSALESEYHKLGFTDETNFGVDFDALMFTLKRDPFSQLDSVEGIWLDGHRQRKGSLIFHADGSFFAEYDVVKPHPVKGQWFVEAVTAWGRGDDVKCEARLLPAM